MTTMAEYEAFTDETAIYPMSMDQLKAGMLFDPGLMYCCLKLSGEVGEVLEHIGKSIRDDGGFVSIERRDKVKKELGDVGYYYARICKHLGFTMEEVLEGNMSKLRDRKERGVLGGSGDDR